MELMNFIKDFRIVPSTIKRLSCLSGYFADPKGFGYINLLFENAYVPKKYRYMFFPKDDGAVFIDCGMNVGWITDIARFMNMEVYGFEPNPTALRLILNKKYANDEKVHIYPYAISDKEGEMDLYIDPTSLFDQGASIFKEFAKTRGRRGEKEKINNSVKVKVKRLTDILKTEILPKHNHIHMLKIDIEGSEFGVVRDLIDEGLYDYITYIVVETHEQFFRDGKKMLKDLIDKIKEKEIENIYLDWY